MKTPLLILLLLAAPTLALAQSSPQPPPDRNDRGAATGETLAERDARVDCIRYTGTRIVRKAPERDAAADKVDELDRDDCVAVGGRVYNQEDLRRTGHTNVADALRVLDPAIH